MTGRFILKLLDYCSISRGLQNHAGCDLQDEGFIVQSTKYRVASKKQTTVPSNLLSIHSIQKHIIDLAIPLKERSTQAIP